MNVRKPVDYGTMYRELTAIPVQNLPQMDEIYAIGKTISQRPEKGAAVAAAEFLQANFPDRTGFSPRNVRRMRDFYRTYENDEPLLRLAMKIGWTLNVIIMEAELMREQRILCLQRIVAEKLSKKELMAVISSGVFTPKPIDESDKVCYNYIKVIKNRIMQPIVELQQHRTYICWRKIHQHTTGIRVCFMHCSRDNCLQQPNIRTSHFKNALAVIKHEEKKKRKIEDCRMPNFCRELITDIQVEQFVTGILEIRKDADKREAINLITEAERNSKDYKFYPTLTHRDNRDFSCRDDDARQELRSQIIEELFSQKRLSNDEDIKLGSGGAAPSTNIKYESKAYYIIGPPAAGKSMISSALADTYGGFILDSDFAKRKLPEFRNQIGGASLVHEESNSLVFEPGGLMERCLGKKANIVIPKIGHDLRSILTFCEGIKKQRIQYILFRWIWIDKKQHSERIIDL